MKYACLPGLTPDGTVYQNSAMGTVEAMLPPGPWATAHAPALLETPDGSLLCAWFAGSFEGSGDVSIVCARLPKGAARWEAPVQVSHDEKRSEQNPSLFLAPDGAVWAVYTAQLDRVPGKDNMQFTSVIRRQKSTDGGRLAPGRLAAFMRSRAADFIYRSESLDDGNTWSEPVPTVLPNNNSSISAVKLQSGRIAVAYNPTHTPAPQPGVAAWPGLRCPVAVALSEDGGLTWPMIRHMELGEGFVGSENSTNNRQYEYPYLMQASDGRLHLAFAYQNRRGVKWMTFSERDVMGEKRETVGVYNPTAARV